MGKVNTQVYITAAFLTFAIFVAGIIIGWLLDQNRVNSITSQIEDIQITMDDLRLEDQFLSTIEDTSSCSLYLSRVQSLSKKTDELASELDTYKGLTYFQAEAIDKLKNKYTILNLDLWLQIVNLRKNCGYNFTTVVYFYSLESCVQCQAQGIVLDAMKKENPGNLMIFAVDSNLDLEIVELIKNNFNVSIAPTLIINEEETFEGFINSKRLNEIIL